MIDDGYIKGPYAYLRWIMDRQFYTMVYLVVCSLWFLPLMGSRVDLLVKVWFIWGILLIIRDLFSKRSMFKSAYWFLAVAFLSSYVVTILMNFESGLYSNSKYLVYNSINLLIIYAQDQDLSKEQLLRFLRLFNDVIIVLAFAAGVISLGMFLLHIGFSFDQGGNVLRQGIIGNRLFGVYTSPNTGALYGVISIGASLVNATFRSRYARMRNVYYLLNAGIQITYFSLSLSRGGFLTYVVLILMISFVFGTPLLYKKKNLILYLIVGLLVFFLVMGGLMLMAEGAQKVSVRVTNAVQDDIAVSDTGAADFVTRMKALMNLDRTNMSSLSSGRTIIWETGYQLWKYAPLFGFGNVKDVENEHADKQIDQALLAGRGVDYLNRLNGNAHNIFVQILVCSGIIGLCIFILFGVLIVVRYIRFLWDVNISDQSYRIVGLIFCVLTAIVANGLVETHLFFNGQDPYGVIFWAYLGVGMLLMERYSSAKEELKSDSRLAFLCDTPYQIFNSINFVSNNVEDSAGCSDIFIYHQFRDSLSVSQELRRTGLFNHVYDISAYNDESCWYTKLRSLKRLLFPLQTMKSHSMTPVDYHKRYEYLFISFSTQFTMNMHAVFKDSRVVWIEDGLSSYFGNVEKDNASNVLRMFKKYIMLGRLDFHPKRVYFNNPEICETTISKQVLSLPKLLRQNPARGVLETVFNYQENSLYANNRYVYLTQPLHEVDGYIPTSLDLISQMFRTLEIQDDLIVRVHPRQLNRVLLNFTVDSCNNLWELECVNQITDQHVLIGAFSTALIVPKIVCDKEPYIIFTYKLFFSNTKTAYWLNVADLIERVVGLYGKPNKIYIPESYEELVMILRGLS